MSFEFFSSLIQIILKAKFSAKKFHFKEKRLLFRSHLFVPLFSVCWPSLDLIKSADKISECFNRAYLWTWHGAQRWGCSRTWRVCRYTVDTKSTSLFTPSNYTQPNHHLLSCRRTRRAQGLWSWFFFEYFFRRWWNLKLEKPKSKFRKKK